MTEPEDVKARRRRTRQSPRNNSPLDSPRSHGKAWPGTADCRLISSNVVPFSQCGSDGRSIDRMRRAKKSSQELECFHQSVASEGQEDFSGLTFLGLSETR